MIALIQRVSEAAVHVNGKTVGEISGGILALVGVEKGDSEAQADRLLQRVLSYRIFPDDEGRMNLDVRQAGGGLLRAPGSVRSRGRQHQAIAVGRTGCHRYR